MGTEYNKEYYKNNKERLSQKKKEWYKTPAGIKSNTISNWKKSGLIDSDGDNYEKRYSAYLEATHCNACKSGFKDTFDRCLDHDHETRLFRQFLCRPCNNMDSWKKKISTAS